LDTCTATGDFAAISEAVLRASSIMVPLSGKTRLWKKDMKYGNDTSTDFIALMPTINQVH
jgi:hypothetical protein